MNKPKRVKEIEPVSVRERMNDIEFEPTGKIYTPTPEDIAEADALFNRLFIGEKPQTLEEFLIGDSGIDSEEMKNVVHKIIEEMKKE